jgi:predicted MPP superfamily phosphohydrolase
MRSKGGIFWRGQRNAERVQVRHNYIRLQRLPRAFNGFTLLHISDLHVDMNEGAMRRLEQFLPDLAYDICAITRDYRGATFGPFDDVLEGMKRLRSHLRTTVYGVLGNHDSIRMVPGLEDMGICVLLNECEPVLRGGESIYLACLLAWR